MREHLAETPMRDNPEANNEMPDQLPVPGTLVPRLNETAPFSTFGQVTTMMAPVTLLALRGLAQLPPWLGVLGLVAFLEQAAETITIFGATGFVQPGGAMNMQLGAMLTLTWLLAFGVWGGIRPNAMAPAERRAT